ncbi:hypothetical protein B0H11DRAFT_2013431 [Mycena galericulata]|nr:hypothetical protein B0H11DRAFT_2013431 [Mycena galericulata]
MSERPLPYGWIKEVDGNTGHEFYVDTKATPPRSIWVHPLEDEQYLREHPEAREKAGSSVDHRPSPSYSAPATPPVASSSNRAGYAAPDGHKPEKRGLFGLFGKSKEEREQEKRHKAEQKRQLLELRERRHQEELRAQAEMYQRQQQQQQMYAQQQAQYQQQYGPQYQPQYQPQPGYAAPQQQRTGFGGGGMALPLLGGLAGGLLLGDVLDGGFGGDGGDDGGDGGDFGGDF